MNFLTNLCEFRNSGEVSARRVYSITLIHPSGASIRPICIPVRVSYNFCVIGPILSIPDGNRISFPWSTTYPTGESTAAVPHKAHSAKSFTSLNGISLSSAFNPR